MILFRGVQVSTDILKKSKKTLTCNLITNLAQTYNYDEWIVFGDMNIITSENDKTRGIPLMLISTLLLIIPWMLVV